VNRGKEAELDSGISGDGLRDWSVRNFVVESAYWLSVLFGIGAVLGCAYALAAAWIAGRFGRTAIMPAARYPAVTILKPLHGAQPQLYGSLAGFCAQDYPSPVQIVCGVADPADPAIATVRDLITAFPQADLELVICSRQHGANRKVSNLINMCVEARHDVLVISDSDIVVDRNYLKTIAASLGQPGVGIVTLPYGGIAAAGLWAEFAAAAIDYHFLPNVLVGLRLGLATPCFGSTIAIERPTLAAVGGLEAVADYLADDYALGALVRGAGLTVAIPGATVMHVCTERSLRELFVHELRWARTVRAIDPPGYAGLAITHALPLAVLAAVLGGMTRPPSFSSPPHWRAATSISLRSTAYCIAGIGSSGTGRCAMRCRLRSLSPVFSATRCNGMAIVTACDPRPGS
jgi:ceramide glucosyltransferase